LDQSIRSKLDLPITPISVWNAAMNDHVPAPSFAITPRNRVRRRPDRGRYDKKTVYDILDAAMICHIAYVIDGQPYCTPTAFWREGDHLYWHGSSASRMIKAEKQGIPVCVTITLADAIVLARCGFNHSVNYRSVMAYGTSKPITDEAEKLAAMDNFIDRFFPGRSKALRPATSAEIKQTTIMSMEMDSAAGKIRAIGVHDEEEDYAVPIWTALLPLRTVVGPIQECERQLPGVTKADGGMTSWQDGRTLDEICLETYRTHYPE
jgi:nitroimidazol reductase NimA-like FMN-containing flavoprotein (pyridoxamine 5'-phosphate oxidase superfamily)